MARALHINQSVMQSHLQNPYDETDGIEYRLFFELVLLTSLLGYFIAS